MKLRYATWFLSDQTYQVSLHCEDRVFGWGYAFGENIRFLAESGCEGESERAKAYVASGAESALWNEIRKQRPDVFVEAIARGWIQQPRDCRACRGRGERIVQRRDDFAIAMRVGYGGPTIWGPALPDPMISAREVCDACDGAGFVEGKSGGR